MMPTICRACGGTIDHRGVVNPNICSACFEGDAAAEVRGAFEPDFRREHLPERSHPPRRRTAAIGDHSHARKTPPGIQRRKHS